MHQSCNTARLEEFLTAERFKRLSTEELAAIYALGVAETRHPGSFSDLADATMRELDGRLDVNVAYE